jgi:hypothetical protein
MQKPLIAGTLGREICIVHSFYTVPLVPSSAFVAAISDERSLCDVFSLGKTIYFGNVKFIANRFSGLSLSPSGTVRMPLSQTPPAVSHCSYSGP